MPFVQHDRFLRKEDKAMHEPWGLWSHDAVPVPLLGVAVQGEILGRSAKVRVSQRFRNEEGRPLEAV